MIALSPLGSWLWVAVGIVISVLLPLIRALLPKPPKAMAADELWQRIRPYIVTAVFAAIVAVLIVAAVGEILNTPAKALIAGYAWDSTLQKLSTGNASLT